MHFKHTIRQFSFCLCLIYVFGLFAEIERFIPRVVAKLPHDPSSFTQGLAIEEDQLYESTGLYGRSSVRRLDILTGQVKEKLNLPSEIFGEGLAVFPSSIFQLTWKEQKVFVYNPLTFKVLKIIPYSGEGWGLCRDGQTLWMSNGTHRLVQRDIQTFAVLKTLDVYQGSRPVSFLNDLESVGDNLYANVYGKEWLVRIDKGTGKVTGVIDASHLLTPQEKASLNFSEVLNGVAYRPTRGTFLLTGKGWPWIFEVQLMP